MWLKIGLRCFCEGILQKVFASIVSWLEIKEMSPRRVGLTFAWCTEYQSKSQGPLEGLLSERLTWKSCLFLMCQCMVLKSYNPVIHFLVCACGGGVCGVHVWSVSVCVFNVCGGEGASFLSLEISE